MDNLTGGCALQPSSLEELWSQTLQTVERELPRTSVEAWLKNTRPLFLDEDTLVIEVPNRWIRDWLHERYYDFLHDALRRCAQAGLQLRFVVGDAGNGAQGFEPVADEVAATTMPVPRLASGQPLNHRYTFDTFVIGSGNRLAHAAALAVAEAPARAYNPLFLYGGVGLGKTHLMQAIAHRVLQRNPNTRVVYVSSETFTNEIINAIRDRSTIEFRNRYRSVDVLLVDDIQFLAGKETTQEEFFHTFNALHESGRQIVVSSDRPPKEIQTLEERLRSRFEWGLVSDIQPPDLETRIAILRKKAQLEQLTVPDDVVYYIAERVTSNIRELEGALIRLVAHASLADAPITLDLAQETLKDLLPAAQPAAITIQAIQEVVADHYGVTVRDLKLRSRARAVAFPRQVAMYLCRELTNASLPKIGEDFGGRDHTTVLHACEKIRAEAEVDPGLRDTLQHLTTRLQRG